MKSVLTPLDFLARSAVVYRSCPAVVDGQRRLTYAEFQQRVHAFASALQRAGIAPGDRVAVLARNSLLALEAHFAVPLIGAVLVMLNIRLQSAELATILNHSGAKILLGDDLVLPLLAIAGEIPQVERIVTNYEEFLRKGNSAVTPHEVGEDDVISINYTSGTTGAPKGVMYTHRGGYINAIGEVVEHGLSNRSVYLWTLPMFHCNGWCFPWAVTAVGARHICLPEVNAERAVDLIEKERCHSSLRRSGCCQYFDRALLATRHSLPIRVEDGNCGRSTAAGGNSRRRRNRDSDRPCLRPHRNLRSAFGVRMAHGVGLRTTGKARAAQGASRCSLRGCRNGHASGG